MRAYACMAIWHAWHLQVIEVVRHHGDLRLQQETPTESSGFRAVPWTTIYIMLSHPEGKTLGIRFGIFRQSPNAQLVATATTHLVHFTRKVNASATYCGLFASFDNPHSTGASLLTAVSASHQILVGQRVQPGLGACRRFLAPKRL
jgi:hypothetical protein